MALNDFGLAIIIATVIIRLILSPLSLKSLKSQKALQELQPRLKEIQEKYKNDRQAQSQAVMQLYKEYNINPFSGCLPILIQLPILFALYRVSISGFSPDSLSVLYPLVENPGTINKFFLGFIDLTRRNIPLVFLAGIFQFIQSKMTVKKTPKSGIGKTEFQDVMNKQILYFFPILTILVAWNFPAGLPLYWVATTVFSIIEQFVINRTYGRISQKPNT